jgi:prepilin-type N-terminal cleavage/methylation domain-containing protein/prepilin-type processing-associated H-X9-DG protein
MRKAFTLIELLVVIAIIAVLIGILLPALGQARRSARTLKCLTQIRSLEQAQTLYAADHDGMLIDAGLAHGGIGNALNAWPVLLEQYNGGPLIIRSPVDNSPFWPLSEGGDDPGLSFREALELLKQGQTQGLGPLARWTSYGLNGYTARSVAPSMRQTYDRIHKVPNPAATVHFLMMTFGTRPNSQQFAKADHVHAEGWSSGPPGSAPKIAALESETGAHGGPAESEASISNYGFLDGHAATGRFGDVYTDENRNRMDPGKAL